MTAILGAGISGLSAAYYALQNSNVTPIVILEASKRVGGWLRSIKQPDGTIFEQGPRSIRANINGENSALELIEQLDLSDRVIPITLNHPAARNRLIYSDKQLHILHNSLKGFIKNTLINRSFFSILWNDFKTPKGSEDDESAYSFIERRFGQDVADKIISSLVCGIYAGDAHKISIKSVINIFFEAEQKHGSVIKGFILEEMKKKKVKSQNTPLNILQKCKKEKWHIWGIKGGIEQLPLALASNITKRGVIIKTKHNCEKLRFNKDHVELTINGEIKRYSYIISSLPAKSLANLVEEQHSELSTELRGIPTVTVGVVNLQFSENISPTNAFGVLIPPKEELPILGILFDSCIFPQNSRTTVLTVMMGGAWFEKYFGNCPSEEHLLTVAINHVNEILHIKEDPIAFNVSILKDCIPQHIVGHMQRLTRIHNYISMHKIPLGLCGSSYQGVAVNDVILSAKQAVSDINSHTL